MTGQEKGEHEPEEQKKPRITFSVWRCLGIIFLGLALLILSVMAGMLAYGGSYALVHYTIETIKEGGAVIVTYVLLLITSAVLLSVEQNRRTD